MNGISRRDFLTSAAVGAVGMAALGNGAFAQAGSPDLVVAGGEDPAKLARAAVEALGGMSKFVSRGDVVLVKPNIGWDRLPQQAANTNPEVVAAVVAMCLEAGAKSVLVQDNTLNDARRCYTRSGIAKAAGDAGATVDYMNSNHFQVTDMGGGVLGRWPVYKAALEVDALINVPIVKHHSLSKLTMGMKNLYGLIGGPRNRLHQKLAEGIADLAAFFKPKLTVLDAYRILARNGPQGGRVSDTELKKQVIAGTDPVAVDAYGAELFGLKPTDVEYITLAAERGLGTWDLSKLNIGRVSV